MHFLFVIFVAVAIFAVTAVVFSGWLVVVISRWLYRLLDLSPRSSGATSMPTSPNHVRCPRSGCHAENLKSARFCRRCGDEIAAVPRMNGTPRPSVMG